MKVLYCNKYNFPFSGTEVYLLELMRMMREHGHQTALFSMADDRGEASEYDSYLMPRVDFKIPTSTLERAHLAAHAIYSREARRRLRKLILQFRPDVAHVRNIYHHLSPSILWELRAQRIPVIYHLNDFKLLCPSYNFVSHGRTCERCRGGEFWRVVTEGCYHGGPGPALVLAAEAYFHKWLHTYDKCVDRFLAPSQFVREKLVESGWDAQKIAVLYHSQAIPESAPSPPLGASILYFGRLSAEKGVSDLVRAMRRVPNVPLQIAGDGPQRGELDSLVRTLKLSNVEFLGHLQGKGLQQCIANSRFTVLPSRAYETLGKSILESYAMGRAVIASDLGPRRELVSEGKTGLLFRSGDIEQLSAAISFLYQRPKFSAEMGGAGRELVRVQHSPQAHYESIIQLYGQLGKKRTWRNILLPPPQSLRVAFIGGRGVISKYSGIEAYYEEVGKRLAEMGHEVTVYCRSYFTPKLEVHNGMRLVRLPTIRSKHLETVVHTALSTLHVLFRRCDIVHYHALGPALFSFLPRLLQKKTVATVQGLDWQRRKWGLVAQSILRLGERAAVRLPNRTMVVSRTLQDYYRAKYRAETLYIPNGSVIRKVGKQSHLANWGLDPGQYVLFLGRFSPEKNCHLLIQAFEPIDTPVKLVLAGGSSYTDAYANELRKHEGEKIRLLNWVTGEALEELLTNAMLFVLPSDLEGLSLALLDAMAAGLCVLTSDIPENRELVEGAGFTFRRRDVADLERMIRMLLSDRQIREEAARQAQERIRTQYLWPQITAQIEASYRALLGWNSDPVNAGLPDMQAPRSSPTVEHIPQ